MKKRIILASASPRRKELLAMTGLEFSCKSSLVEEKITKFKPEEVVEELSVQKARDIMSREQWDCIVIGSDTVVSCEGQILGKPKDKQDAEQMLTGLAGREHQVYTGVAILIKQAEEIKEKVFHECTKVYVYPMSKQEITDYVQTGEPMDKAGGYGIQTSFGLKYIQKIDGDYYNVVGLPVSRLYQELKLLKVLDAK